MKEPLFGSGFSTIQIENNRGDIVPITELSSGEQMIASLIMWSHNSNTGNYIKCMLLDEVDAYLHPSLSKIFIDILKNVIVDEYKINVILVTHSPSTIAYAPEDSIYTMGLDEPRIQKQTKKESIRLLTDGMVAIVNNDAEMILSLSISDTIKPILCVEGITDKKILKVAWEKLYGDKDLPFVIQEFFDCYFIVNSFLRGDIFNNNPNNFFVGLLDFDRAYDVWKEKMKPTEWPRNTFQDTIHYWKSNSKNGAMLPIPVPNLRASYAGHEIRYSYLSIELLFSDRVVSKYCTEIAVAGGASLYRFDDRNKFHFSNDIVKELSIEDFGNFIPLFEAINHIIETSCH
jgi:hypothetical protein